VIETHGARFFGFRHKTLTAAEESQIGTSTFRFEEPRSAGVSRFAHEPPPHLATVPISVLVNRRLRAGSRETSALPDSSF
jgi:hypothetical protein